MVNTSASYKYLRKSPCETNWGPVRQVFDSGKRFWGIHRNFSAFHVPPGIGAEFDLFTLTSFFECSGQYFRSGTHFFRYCKLGGSIGQSGWGALAPTSFAGINEGFCQLFLKIATSYVKKLKVQNACNWEKRLCSLIQISSDYRSYGSDYLNHRLGSTSWGHSALC
jgi:hypothetical protein